MILAIALTFLNFGYFDGHGSVGTSEVSLTCSVVYLRARLVT